MIYRKLGNTGLDVSILGFGMWQLGGMRWRNIPESECIELLREANDLGINIFDSAVVYGQYEDGNGLVQSRSLDLLAKAFSTRREKVIYCIKVGQFDEYSHRSNYDPDRLILQIKQSLARLKADYLDVCLIHAPSLKEVKSQRAISVLKTLRALGFVKSIGYSFECEPEHLKVALNQDIDVVMLQHNILDMSCAELFDEANELGVGILAGGPFKRGYLTGKYISPENLPQTEGYWKWNLDKNYYKCDSILQQVRQLLKDSGSSRELRRKALQFVLEKAPVASAIVGHQGLEEVFENLESVISRDLNRSETQASISKVVNL